MNVEDSATPQRQALFASKIKNQTSKIKNSFLISLALSLATIEGFSCWWMHPAPAGLGEPVLVYRPETGKQLADGSEQTTDSPRQPTANRQPPTPSSNQQSTIDNQQSSISSSPSSSSPSTINSQPSTSSLTPLPEIYSKAAPMLRCSGGQVNYAKLSDSSGIHLAFFEWDGTDTGSVLEAFRHMPEYCMGSIGMILVSREKPVPYTVDGETLLFDHTVFREPSQSGGGGISSPLIHAFRAVWVAGVSNANAREGLGGDDFNRLRTIRLKSAINRFRPQHARVIQGAVRGLPSSDLAWEAFENAMLKDLHMEKR